jgi:pimeloyl-ACP methyl ester carboxylesterase
VFREVLTAVTRASAAIDRGVLRVMERRMSTTAPRALPRDARARLIELAATYRDADLFPVPPPAEVSERKAGEAFGVPVTSIRFASAYRPFLPAFRDEHHRCVENHTAHARLYGSGRRPVMVCLHGWGGGAWWLEERAFVIGYWLRRGFDVALFQLPYHGARAPRAGSAPGRTPRSGALFPSANLVRTNEAFGQAIFDLRAFAEHLRGRGAPAVGAIGMSLGGYTTALWASLDPAPAFAVAMIPAVSMSELMWRHGEDSPARRRAAAAGVSGDLLDDVFAVHAPTSRPPLLPRQRLMIVAGEGDRITPPDQAEMLWRHWGECAIHWFPGGHLAQVGRGDAFRAVRKHLAAAGLPGTPARDGAAA